MSAPQSPNRFVFTVMLFSDSNSNLDFILQVSIIEAQTSFAAVPKISHIFTPLSMQAMHENMKQEDGTMTGYLYPSLKHMA